MPDESLSRDKHPPAIRAGDFKTLSGFLRGYLHQDFHLEYKNPQAAAQAYCRDATRQQVDRARNELQRFLDKTRTVPFESVQQLLGAEFHSGWIPDTREKLAELLGGFERR